MFRTRGPEPGARRQGDLDPNLPRATRSSEFKSAASFLSVSRTDPSSMFHPSLQSALHIVQKPRFCYSQCETSADQRICVCVDLPVFPKKNTILKRFARCLKNKNAAYSMASQHPVATPQNPANMMKIQRCWPYSKCQNAYLTWQTNRQPWLIKIFLSWMNTVGRVEIQR